MERLTFKVTAKDGFTKYNAVKNDCVDCHKTNKYGVQIGEHVDRLAELEYKIKNGELVEPETAVQISKNAARIHEILEVMGGNVLDRLEELKILKDKLENGLMVELPCKIGDTVYVVGSKYRAGSYDTWVNTGKFKLGDLERLGKSVFVTEKEALDAELKLKESEGK